MDKNSFTTKVLDCEQTLYRISMTMLKNEKDCEDAVQESILSAFSRLNTLKKEEYFTTWLISILINQCKKQLRYRKKFSTDEIADGADENNPYISTEIKMAIESLPEKIRIVIVMYYVEQFSVKEIKSVLHIPEGTVKSRLAKGRDLLKLQMATE